MTVRQAWIAIFDEYERVSGKRVLEDWYAYERWLVEQKDNPTLADAFAVILRDDPAVIRRRELER